MSNEDDPLRGTGRTTRLMLMAIIEALANPGRLVRFKDHYEDGGRFADAHAHGIKELLQEAGVRNYCVETVGGKVLLKALPNPMLEIIP